MHSNILFVAFTEKDFALCLQLLLHSATPTRRKHKKLVIKKLLLFFSTKKNFFLVTKIKSIFVLCKNGNQSFFNAKDKKLNSSAQKKISCYKKSKSILCFVKQMENSSFVDAKVFCFLVDDKF
jgi:hypothetical protein